MERRRANLTDYQKKIIRQKAADKARASKETIEALDKVPRCKCHDYLEPFCPNRLRKDASIPF